MAVSHPHQALLLSLSLVLAHKYEVAPADTCDSCHWQQPSIRCNKWESAAATHNDGITEHGNRGVVRHFHTAHGISGLVAEYIVAIDVTRARFLADALSSLILLVYAGPCT